MIRHGFLQQDGNGRTDAETQALLEGLGARNVSTELFVKKRLVRRQLPITRNTLVAGELPIVEEALRQLGCERRPASDYPLCLRDFLHRRIWESTVRTLITDLLYGSGAGSFAKPLERKKRFTGRVFNSPSDLFHLQGASRSTKLLCSEIVQWLSEYRVYVVRGEVVGVCHYGGDRDIAVDLSVVERAVRALEGSPERTAGYGIDFGVLANGVTALVEWNDGFALGCYGLDAGLYTDLIVARWCELVAMQ